MRVGCCRTRRPWRKGSFRAVPGELLYWIHQHTATTDTSQRTVLSLTRPRTLAKCHAHAHPQHPHTPTPSHPHTPTLSHPHPHTLPPSHPHTLTPSHPHTPTPSQPNGARTPWPPHPRIAECPGPCFTPPPPPPLPPSQHFYGRLQRLRVHPPVLLADAGAVPGRFCSRSRRVWWATRHRHQQWRRRQLRQGVQNTVPLACQ
jgi:hypothetical protein